ncbi:hypothetical protein MTO96_051766 [Rhipicephalus appendiculatus]
MQVSWLWDNEHPFLSSLSRRISLASGLSLESSEAYQVANYGLGGHYTPHDDASNFDQIADEWDTGSGNRVATMLLYLTDVSLGGRHSIRPSEAGREATAWFGTFLVRPGTVLG